MQEKITLIIPVHNSESTINKCVDSILNQTYGNLEIFLVNNGSTDNSLSICKSLAQKDNRIQVINLDEGNVSKARNAALVKMTGDYFAFIDSDDYVDSEMYDKMITKAKEKKADMVFCRFNTEVNGTIKPCQELRLKELVYNRQFQYIFKTGNDYVKANIWRTLFRTAIFNNIRFDEQLFFGEDFVYMFNVFQTSCNMVLLEDYLYNYTLSPISMSKKYFNINMLKNDKLYSKYSYEFLYSFGMENYAVAARYGSWIHVVHSILAYSNDYRKHLHMVLNDEYWQDVKNKKYYKQFMHLLCPSFKYKMRAFLLQHRLFYLYRFLIKILI